MTKLEHLQEEDPYAEAAAATHADFYAAKERKKLEKKVADTQAVFAAAWDDAWHTDAVWDAADAVYDDAAYAALVKARRELAKYLKEQDK